MKKKFLLLTVLTLVVALCVMAFVACNSNSNTNTNEEEEEDLGFTEVTIFEGHKESFLVMNGVYFQAVDMTGGYSASDYDCHLELDISAGENNYGYGVGDWVPYLTIAYSVTKNSEVVASGTFMPMAASDGPHYGANIKMNGDGAYKVTFTITFPDTSTQYLIHTDSTGPESSTFPSTITFTEDWNYVADSWL